MTRKRPVTHIHTHSNEVDQVSEVILFSVSGSEGEKMTRKLSESRLVCQSEMRSVKLKRRLTQHLGKIGIMQVRVFVGESLSFCFCPNHEGIHGPSDSLFS